MLKLCKIHNKSEYTNVSRKVKKILSANCLLFEYDFSRITVYKKINQNESVSHDYYLEKEDVMTIGLNFERKIYLYDRDIEMKEMNDRFIIQKMKIILDTVCDECFEPLAQLHLWDD